MVRVKLVQRKRFNIISMVSSKFLFSIFFIVLVITTASESEARPVKKPLRDSNESLTLVLKELLLQKSRAQLQREDSIPVKYYSNRESPGGPDPQHH